MTTRIGIVGGGDSSDTHARAAREIPGVEVVAMWGRDGATMGRRRAWTEAELKSVAR